jgi:predicted DNA-binding protein with PD1-like motif
MKASQGKMGRVFIIRLEDGDKIPDCIEKFASDNEVSCAQLIMIGGIGSGQVVVGPRYSDRMPPEPMVLPIDGAHETVGLGLLVPGDDGKPNLHLHASLGRSGQTVTGCLRSGVATWLVGEVIMCEILNVKADRKKHAASGFSLLEPEDNLE